jgi:hypothetical protein
MHARSTTWCSSCFLSVIVTAYDRYRPLHRARFAGGPLQPPA